MSHESTPAGGCSADGTNPTPAAEQATIAAALKVNMVLVCRPHEENTSAVQRDIFLNVQYR